MTNELSNTKNEKNAFSVRVAPENHLRILSHLEVEQLRNHSQSGLYHLLRQCALAVLNCGSHLDDAKRILEKYHDFDIEVVQQEKGIKLLLTNPPKEAFVDGQMIKGIKEHLFSVLRDIIYIQNEIENHSKFDLDTPQGITNAVFHILRNADLFQDQSDTNLVVCWGGHSISREEYDYTKEVGYALGLRGLNVGTGCGPGAMKGPMKGATIGHAKQHIRHGKYIGLTEPGIIAAEPPNPIVNQLVILPDIEKRLEAFLRLAHGIIIFPGGAGTAEEILYILGILLHPKNKNRPYPLVLTAGSSSTDYFELIKGFLTKTLGKEVLSFFTFIENDPEHVAIHMRENLELVRAHRRETKDAYYYNWLLHIEEEFQHPFIPSHENMQTLELHKNQETYKLASNLRKAFSGIVAGNVKEQGIKEIEEKGPFKIKGSPEIMEAMDELLKAFSAQGRMKLAKEDYTPCYEIIK